MSRKYWLILSLALLLTASAGYWTMRGQAGKAQVIQKVEQGASEQELLESIRGYDGIYELDVGDIIDLKKRGVPENAIVEMLNHDQRRKESESESNSASGKEEDSNLNPR